MYPDFLWYGSINITNANLTTCTMQSTILFVWNWMFIFRWVLFWLVFLILFWNYTKHLWVIFFHLGICFKIHCNDAIISALVLHFTPSIPGVSSFGANTLEKKNLCKWDICIGRVLSRCLGCYPKNFSHSPANRGLTETSFLLSLLLAPSWGWVLWYGVVEICKVVMHLHPFLRTCSKQCKKLVY